MSVKAIANAKRLIAGTEKGAPHLVNFVVTLADLRALVALAEEAEALKAALARIRDGKHKTWESPRDLAAEALAPPRTKPPKPPRRRSMFTPEQERIIRECEAGDEMPAPKPARGKLRRR